MDTKKLLVFIAGAAVAVFVMKQLDKNKRKPVEVTPPAPEDPKMVACQAQLADALMTVRTTDIEGFKKQFIADCMAAPMVEGTTGNIPADIPATTPPILDENQPLDTQLGL